MDRQQGHTKRLTRAELEEIIAVLDKQLADSELPHNLPVDVDFEKVECSGGVETNFFDDIASS